MKTILITGAGGYLGKHIVQTFLEQTVFDIIAVDFNSCIKNDRVTYLQYDFLENANALNLYDDFKRPDIILHLAWQDGFNHNVDSHIKNLYAHYEFLRNMIESGCRNISVMGSMHEIGYYEGMITSNTPCNPLSNYGIAKNALRQLMMNYTLDKEISFKWLRAFYITGDDKNNKSIFTKILQMAEEGKATFPFTDGANQYDFLDVEILAEQIIQASIQTSQNGIIHCCSGKPVALKEQVEEFIKQHHLNIKPEYGVFPSRKYDSPCVYGDNSLIQKIMEQTNEE